MNHDPISHDTKESASRGAHDWRIHEPVNDTGRRMVLAENPCKQLFFRLRYNESEGESKS